MTEKARLGYCVEPAAGIGAMSAAVVGMKVFVALLISVWVYAVWLFRKNTVERMFL